MKLIPPNYLFAFAFVLILIGTDDFPHSGLQKPIYLCHIDTSPEFDFRLRFCNSEGEINSENILFRFDLISVAMVVNIKQVYSISVHLKQLHLKQLLLDEDVGLF